MDDAGFIVPQTLLRESQREPSQFEGHGSVRVVTPLMRTLRGGPCPWHSRKAASEVFVTRQPVAGGPTMKHHLALHRSLLALSLSLATLPAWAGDDCDAPVERWQSREAVRKVAVSQGWQIQRLKIDDGCYELRGTDAQGRAFKAKIDPETLKVLKMKTEDPQRARERERERAHPAPSPASASGMAPRSRVE